MPRYNIDMARTRHGYEKDMIFDIKMKYLIKFNTDAFPI